MDNNELKVGDFVKKIGTDQVGRISAISSQPWDYTNTSALIKIKPAGVWKDRNSSKARWASARVWKKISPLELIAAQI